MSWTDFPVMNLHPHAWPLYSAAKLLGLEFHASGANLRPDLPLAEYEFRSPLLGFKKFNGGYAGWYAPSVAGRWTIALGLSGPELARVRQLRVNGATRALPHSAQTLEIAGESRPGAPLRWEISVGADTLS
jgi:hypothetical protein